MPSEVPPEEMVRRAEQAAAQRQVQEAFLAQVCWDSYLLPTGTAILLLFSSLLFPAQVLKWQAAAPGSLALPPARGPASGRTEASRAALQACRPARHVPAGAPQPGRPAHPPTCPACLAPQDALAVVVGLLAEPLSRHPKMDNKDAALVQLAIAFFR